MPTTTNYGWTTPADTDLVKDGASAIRTLGSAIDTTVFNNASAAIAKTIVDAKGDIIAGTAADTVARLAVGANDTVLTADSSTATGLKWSASGGKSFYPLIKTGTAFYHFTSVGAGTTASADVITEDLTIYSPIYFTSCTLDQISIKTGTTFSGSAVVRLGIYQADANNFPNTLLLDAGTVTPTAANTAYTITISQTISTAGLYYLAFNAQTAAATNSYVGITGGTNAQWSYGNRWHTTAQNQNSFTGFQETGITGAFANTTTTAGYTVSSMPTVWVRNS